MSAKVTQRSNALDLERDVFKWKDPRKIALSLKRSAQINKRRKGTPYQSAMSMLNFYINRAGKNLPQKQKRVLEQAKGDCATSSGANDHVRWGHCLDRCASSLHRSLSRNGCRIGARSLKARTPTRIWETSRRMNAAISFASFGYRKNYGISRSVIKNATA